MSENNREQHRKLYKTREWKEVRAFVIDRDRSICYFCHKLIGKRATVHHKQEVNEENWLDPEIALNPENLVACHPSCHNEHHERFGYKHTIVDHDLNIDYSKRNI